MKKIAIINQRYGKEVVGGSEYYSKLLAGQLSKYFEVEVLTTKALDHVSWENWYKLDIEYIDGVKIIRFAVNNKRNKLLLKIMNQFHKILKINGYIFGKIWEKAQGPNVPRLIRYIKQNKRYYDAFIFITYLYYPTVVGLPVVKEKAILVPTAHDEYALSFHIFDRLFQQPAAFVFLTEEEKEFVRKKYNNDKIPGVVAAVGIDIPKNVDENRFRKKYNVEGKYFIYVGRVEEDKGCLEMFSYFEKLSPIFSDFQLVVIGKTSMDIPENSKINYLGYLSEEDKYDAIKGAWALWMPSCYESLSLSVLEAMALSNIVIVNGKSAVLRGHCERSGGGVFYDNYEELKLGISRIDTEIRKNMSEKARQYIESCYTWEYVNKTWREIIEGITGRE